MTKNILKFKTIKVPVDDLILDPNNPRFSRHKDDLTDIKDFESKNTQEYTFNRMMEEFSIDELESSIKEKGFTPVDNVFVKKIGDKYLVVEGNRRITAVKSLLKKHKEGKNLNDKLDEDVLGTLTDINCYDLSDNTDDDIDFILGLRHHGSIKPWGFLPASFNIYKRYMVELDKKMCDDFEYIPDLAKEICRIYSLSQQDVREKIQTYSVYLQIKKYKPDFRDLDNKFSIVGDSIKNKKTREEFCFDNKKCTFSDEGVEKFIDLVYGSPFSNIKPVIVGAATGEGNIRDFAYVLAETCNYEEDVQKRIYEERTDPSVIKAELKTKKTERDMSHTLELVRDELKKIKLGENFGLGEEDKEILLEIQSVVDKIKKLSDL